MPHERTVVGYQAAFSKSEYSQGEPRFSVDIHKFSRMRAVAAGYKVALLLLRVLTGRSPHLFVPDGESLEV